MQLPISGNSNSSSNNHSLLLNQDILSKNILNFALPLPNIASRTDFGLDIYRDDFKEFAEKQEDITTSTSSTSNAASAVSSISSMEVPTVNTLEKGENSAVNRFLSRSNPKILKPRNL